jgi:hypothetical protein
MHTYKLRTIPSNSDIPESRISFDQLIVIKVRKMPKQVLLLPIKMSITVPFQLMNWFI